MPSTWIANDVIENILQQTFIRTDIEFSKLFETQVHTPEERLTGFFVEKLFKNSEKAQASIQSLLTVLDEPWYFTLQYRDMTGTEKHYGADIAFLLRSSIPEKMRRQKVVFVQCKKMRARQKGLPSLVFYPSWPIDRQQAENLCDCTQFGYYFLYGPHSQGIMTRVIPARSVLGIMDATGRKTTIPSYQAIMSSRSFADFLFHDFVGCWAGDETDESLRIAYGQNEEFGVRYLVSIDLSRG